MMRKKKRRAWGDEKTAREKNKRKKGRKKSEKKGERKRKRKERETSYVMNFQNL